MLAGKKILGVIPARGGSKGIPRKNIQKVAGKPLIVWSIEEANKSKYLDRVILSSEDEEIIQVAKAWGCEVPFVRPKDLAQDATPGVEPILHALRELPGYDYVVMLQPTSPLRSVEDIDGCIEKCLTAGAMACVSVTEPAKHPFWMYRLDKDGFMHPFVETEKQYFRRQDLPEVYALNGAVYVAERRWLFKTMNFLTTDTLAYKMPQERSMDVDTNFDLNILDVILSTRE